MQVSLIVQQIPAAPKTLYSVSKFFRVLLKGQRHEIFCFWFFHESVSPQPQSIPVGPFQIFSKIRGDIFKSRCTNGINDTGGKFAIGINNTSRILCQIMVFLGAWGKLIHGTVPLNVQGNIRELVAITGHCWQQPLRAINILFEHLQKENSRPSTRSHKFLLPQNCLERRSMFSCNKEDNKPFETNSSQRQQTFWSLSAAKLRAADCPYVQSDLHFERSKINFGC